MASHVCRLHFLMTNRTYRSAVASRSVTLPFTPVPGIPLTGYAARPEMLDEGAFQVLKTVWVGKEDGLEGQFEVELRGLKGVTVADPSAFASTVLGPKWSIESDSIAG